MRRTRSVRSDDATVDELSRARERAKAVARAIRRKSGELLKSAKEETSRRGKSAVRRAVTGSAETRVRDFVKIPRVIRQIDKVSFCVGVFGLMMTEYVATRAPEKFWMFYAFAMPAIVCVRAVYYRMIRWQYFLYDFCYFANVSVLVFLWTRRSATAFRCIFAFANGPVLLAIPLWRNSLVFHSVDKVQSVFVHAMPCLMTWCGRWYGFGEDENRLSVADLDSDVTVLQGSLDLMVYPMLAYLLWQTLYLVKTEYVDKAKLDTDPALMTSLRWLASDRKSAANKFALKTMRGIGLFGADEFFDPKTWKTKFVFVMFQLCYTIVTFIPIPFCYLNYYAHTALMWVCFGTSVYNGAVYYIDIFSTRYVERLALAEELIRCQMVNELTESELETMQTMDFTDSEIEQILMTPVD